jgi:putative tryptophan/tyrosine transport system substrate-binding protein
MRRRDLAIGLLLAAAVGTVRAQERAEQHRIAIIIPAGPVALVSETSSDAVFRRLYEPFFEELHRLGDIEGQALIVERYSGEGRPEGFPDLARAVVGHNPDVIVAITNPVALAVRAATGTIPIVWIGVEAIGEGLATSLAHPGGNVTGIVNLGAELDGKRLELLHELVPAATRISLLAYARLPRSAPRAAAMEALARPLGVRVTARPVSEAAEIDGAFTAIVADHDQAMLVEGGAVISQNRPRVIALAAQYRLPAIYENREFAESGGLLSYAQVFRENFERAAALVGKILKGAKPADLPVEQPTRFELIVNLMTARALDLTVPPSILARADEVIE